MQFETAAGMTRGLNTHIARDIARKILSGELACGAILPSEIELGEQFGVSRTALREALKLLTSKGLLESRPKNRHTRKRASAMEYARSATAGVDAGHGSDRRDLSSVS